MIYSPDGAMSKTKMWFGPSLGNWHSYKQANAIVFRKFQNEFFGQLHFVMFPGQPFYPNQKKLSKNVMLLSWVRLAFPSFRSELYDAIQLMESSNSLAKAGCRHLLNLKFLCEWLIPVVGKWASQSQQCDHIVLVSLLTLFTSNFFTFCFWVQIEVLCECSV